MQLIQGREQEKANHARGSNLLGVRLYNERLILQVIRREGSLPKAEIARMTGLSAQTVSVIINRLLKNRLLHKQPGKRKRGRVGQPAIPIALNPEGAYSVGVKIGRSSLDIMIVNFVGEVLQRVNHRYEYPDPDSVFNLIDVEIESLTSSLSEAQMQRIVGIGVAAPHALGGWQSLVGVPEERLLLWNEIDIVERVGRNQSRPVWFSNDATAACIAELEFGDQALWNDFLYVFVGTFIGGGVVQNGVLNAGSRDNAGAIGSMPVPAMYSGEAADAARASAQLINCASHYLLNNRLREAGLDPDVAIEQLQRGDRDTPVEVTRIFEDWLQNTAQAIAVAVTAAVSVIDFEGVVIDGLLPSKQIDRLRSLVEQSLDEGNMEGLLRPQIKSGSFGNDARAIGGAVLPFYNNFTPNMSVLLKIADNGV